MEHYVNNHIHTTYSFSPYSPVEAVKKSLLAGLVTAGIMDHDSVSGAAEFIAAGAKLGLPTTAGFECRVRTTGTALEGRRINNPDQKGIAYIAVHGVPVTQLSVADAFLAPYRAKRNERNRKMLARINEITGFSLDFDRDVVPLSNSGKGGSITERHLLYALSLEIIKKYGKGAGCIDFVENSLNIKISDKIKEFLSDKFNIHYEYDLLGVLKGNLVSSFYIDADEECPHITEIVAFAKKIGAISAYAYLGDVGESVTGDKKAQKFEDDYLDLLFDTITALGFNAVTYMPSRNTREQLTRVRNLCDSHGLFQISGEDINSSRQKFICPAMENPEFKNLIISTWALIGHEKAANNDINDGIFGSNTIKKFPDLKERIAYFEALGRQK